MFLLHTCYSRMYTHKNHITTAPHKHKCLQAHTPTHKESNTYAYKYGKTKTNAHTHLDENENVHIHLYAAHRTADQRQLVALALGLMRSTDM